MVSIEGNFPSQVYVWFGDQPGQLVYHTSNWILVDAPAASQAGSVDLTLRSPSAGTVLLLADGFTYLHDGPTPTTNPPPTPTTSPTTNPSPTSAPTSGPTSTTSGGGGTSTTSGGGGGTPTSPTPSSTPTSPAPGPTTSVPSTTSAPGPTTTTAPTTSTTAASTTTPPGPARQPRPGAAGGPLDLAGGLRGVPLQGLGGLTEVTPCTTDPCRFRRI